ncbi:putative superfamily III holin-X [Motilibacter rhizosphaerae]|uniref:Putative superfamily III holin-X n=1 Tax=Motilibacter rhizosphaerae TaxID=598652 RepID=A0A4V2F2T4_9ACTN|nr:phage holin family protein [Motilibacter rhizosphaerae]RZS80004.1 putative superfamily III holin-X [Motilibacter rhizosphaerae]
MSFWGAVGEGRNGLLNAVTEEVGGRVRREIRSAQDDVLGRLRSAGTGLTLLGGAGALGALALGSAAVLVIRVLEAVLPKRLAAFAATVVFGGGAAALGTAGLRELQRAKSRG